MTDNKVNIDFFPLSIAEGQAFCNRVEEISQLKYCIEHLRPVLLVSPRRYGKTSLALHAISQLQLPYVQFDFFSVVDESDIERVILQGAGKMISCLESIPKRALALANEVFEGTNITVSLNNIGVSIDINRNKEKPAYHVLDVLERLERLAIKANKKIILFFDEFQCVGEIAPNHAIEAVLRQVAQLTKSIAFVFSGSNRHLLNQMFEDRNRPFYKLCEKITIDRISEIAYQPHLQYVAQRKWDAEFSQRELDAIFSYTGRHPYYMNLLCSRLIIKACLPTTEEIRQVWHHYMIEERASVASELELLSKNQRKLLTVLARIGGIDAPLGYNFIQQANMSKATLSQSLSFLKKKDYIFKDTDGYIRVLDPLILSVLSEHIW